MWKNVGKKMINILCPLWLGMFQNSKEKNGDIKLWNYLINSNAYLIKNIYLSLGIIESHSCKLYRWFWIYIYKETSNQLFIEKVMETNNWNNFIGQWWNLNKNHKKTLNSTNLNPRMNSTYNINCKGDATPNSLLPHNQ
jgi:hypothetical protein